MLRRTICCILITLLSIGTLTASDTVAQQVSKTKVGRKVKVKLISGEILKGRMGPSTSEQFTLESRSTAPGTTRTVQFVEAQSVKPDGLTTGAKWTIAGVVWVALAIIGKFI
jgi:hypothetical protein